MMMMGKERGGEEWKEGGRRIKDEWEGERMSGKEKEWVGRREGEGKGVRREGVRWQYL